MSNNTMGVFVPLILFEYYCRIVHWYFLNKSVYKPFRKNVFYIFFNVFYLKY